MGHTIWIEAKGRGSETHNDMSVLHAVQKELDDLAGRLGVTKLTAFYDYEALLDYYKDEVGSDDSVEAPGPSWFDSADGLKSVATIRKELEESFDSLKLKSDKPRKHYEQKLLEDLRFCQSVLEKALADGQSFRLLVVP